jgi:fructuronate reductase
VAGWMRYVTGVDERGRLIDVRDPMATRLRTLAGNAGYSAERIASGLFSVREIFGDDLPRGPAFTTAVTGALDSLFKNGARQTVAELH